LEQKAVYLKEKALILLLRAWQIGILISELLISAAAKQEKTNARKSTSE